MGRRRSSNPKRHQLCVRLDDRQMELLREYTDFKGLDSEVSSIRKMIDGLEDWLKRQRAARRAEAAAPGGEHNSGLSQPTDVTRTDVLPRDVMENINSVGDFAGRPSVGLPEPRFDED